MRGEPTMHKIIRWLFLIMACGCYAIGVICHAYSAFVGGGLFAIAYALCSWGTDHA